MHSKSFCSRGNSRARLFHRAKEVVALIFVFYLWMHSQSVMAAEAGAGKSMGTLWLEAIEKQDSNEREIVEQVN